MNFLGKKENRLLLDWLLINLNIWGNELFFYLFFDNFFKSLSSFDLVNLHIDLPSLFQFLIALSNFCFSSLILF